MSDPIRVLVVDDSAFMRYTLSKYLKADSDIVVVGSARNGQDALTKLPLLRPDVITLDVEMPGMDGLATLQQIMAEYPTPVIMLSALTQHGTRTTIQALMRGAVEFVPKPAGGTDLRATIEELIFKIKTAAGTRLKPLRYSSPVSTVTNTGGPPVNENGKPPQVEVMPVLSPFQPGDPVIVIGASTGGPRALHQLLTTLPADLPAAILVVQHMPPGFTRSLAQRLNESCALSVQEAVDGDRLARQLILLAPGDYHLYFKNSRQIALSREARRHYVRPSVDVTMESASQYHGSAVIGVVLTGMGVDGTAGAGCIKGAGGRVIAEHESTSVVYGMPRSIVEAGLADRVVPLPDIASILVEWVHHGITGI